MIPRKNRIRQQHLNVYTAVILILCCTLLTTSAFSPTSTSFTRGHTIHNLQRRRGWNSNNRLRRGWNNNNRLMFTNLYSGKTTNEDTNNNDNNNFFTSLFNSSEEEEGEEDKKQKERQLRIQNLNMIEAGEKRRQQRVYEDKFLYLFIFALQFLPLCGNNRFLSIGYFFSMAVTTVYLGGRQEVIEKAEQVSRSNALYAPIGASLAIGGLYLLLKVGIDVTSFYAVLVSIFGTLAIADIGVPILRNVFTDVDFASAEVSVPQSLANKLDLDKPALPLDGLITLALGVLTTLIYWSPIAMQNKFIVSNVIAWALGMVSLGAISLGSFQTGALLLAGLFCYDIFWVFGTDVMMTVATKVEAPVKFIYTAPPSDTPKSYPFSVLGLGDVVIPGLFVRLTQNIDEVLQPKNLSYFNVAVAAYAAGLALCFGANEIFHNGQPALLYLDPSLVGSTLACAALNDQVPQLWDFKEEEEVEEEPEGI